MISKKEFVNIIDRLRNYDDMRKEIKEIARNYIEPTESDFTNVAQACVGHETVVVDLLRDIFQDKGSDVLGWWLWELDYGRKFKIGYLIDENKKKIDLSTSEKLYDYLISNMEVNGDEIYNK